MEKQITVLLADDHKLTLEGLKLLLSDHSHIKLVGEANNGEETIELAITLSPDIILMDINMSPVNGFEATRKILKQNPSIRIIGLSMHKEATYCKNLLRLGAKGYVIKSSLYEEVIPAINEVASGGKYIDKGIIGNL
jgi:DNA-binding NarL/FixJ family response regulator